MDKRIISVIGAGSSGLALAAHLQHLGCLVRLWSRESSLAEQLRINKRIHLKGVIDCTSTVELVTSDLKEAVTGASLVISTVPAMAHLAIAEQLAPCLQSGQHILLTPGRTTGVLSFSKALAEYGAPADVLLGETQTILYTCRRETPESCRVYTLKNKVLLGGRSKDEGTKVLAALPEELQGYFDVAGSIWQTALGNVGPMLHCVPMLLNSGQIEYSQVPLKFYHEAITPRGVRLIEKLDDERVQVAASLGISVPSLKDWLQTTYGVKKNDLYSMLLGNPYYSDILSPTSLQHRYIEEDVPTGLVPMESVGKITGVETPFLSLVIDLANVLLGKDYRQEKQYFEQAARSYLSKAP